MENPSTGEVIFIVVLAAVSFILFAAGTKTNRKRITSAGAILAVSIIAVSFIRSEFVRDVLTSFSAVAASLLAAISINEVRREKDEKKLKTILDWAIEVLNLTEKIPIEDFVVVSNERELKFKSSESALDFLSGKCRAVDKLREMSARGTYIFKLAEKYKNLNPVVDKLIKRMKKQIQFLASCKLNMPISNCENEARQANANDQNISLYARGVIDEIAKLM